MTPTKKQIEDFYKSRDELEVKLNMAMGNIPKIDELQIMVHNLIVVTERLKETVTIQSKNIETLTSGFEANKIKINSLDKDFALLQQSELLESKKISLPLGILISVVVAVLSSVITLLVSHFMKFL